MKKLFFILISVIASLLGCKKTQPILSPMFSKVNNGSVDSIMFLMV